MFLRSVFLTLSLCVFALHSFADEGAIYRQQIKSYYEALHSGDQKRIQATWQAIVNNPEAIDYLKEFRPHDLFVVQTQGLLKEVEAIEGANKERPVVTKKFKAKIQAPKLPVQQEGRVTKTNGDIAEERSRIPLIDNREYALRYPNQNKRTNEEIISSRLDRLYRQIQERFE